MTSIEELFEETLEKVQNGQAIEISDEWEGDPPTFDDFISSGRYIKPVILSARQRDVVLKVLGDNPKKIFSPERQFSLGVLVVGKGGGKDFLIAIIMCYVVTVLMHLRNPQRFLGIDENLDLLNVSIKGKNAEEVFFNKFRARIEENKYFSDNFAIYKDGKPLSKPKNKSKGTIRLAKIKAEFPNRITCYSESSNNESWEGYNVIFYVLDEISGFISEKKQANGWAIYGTAQSSQTSRSSETFQGIGFVISYPRQEKNDIILDLWEDSKKEENSFIYAMRCFTWQFRPTSGSGSYGTEMFEFVNPRFNRAFNMPEAKPVGIMIPIKFKKDFMHKPEESMTRYCAIPPRAAGNWVEYQDRFVASIDQNQEALFLTEKYVITKEINGKKYDFLGKRIIACTEKNTTIRRHYNYVAWLDNAEVNCDAVIVIARKEIIVSDDGTEMAICRIVDVINWLPEPKRGLAIDLENVEDFLLNQIPLYINLKTVGKDRWESATLHQKLIKKGIESIRYNLSGYHYDIGKYFFYFGAVRIFNEERYFLNKDMKEISGIDQILSLVNSPTGPIKKDGFKKDKSDGIIGCINLLMGNDFTDANRPRTQKTDGIGRPRMVGDPYKSKPYNVHQSIRPQVNMEATATEEKKLPLPRKA